MRRIRQVLFLSLVACVSALAQTPELTFLYRDPTASAAVSIGPNGVIQFPSTLVNSTSTVQFFVTNIGSSPVNLSAIGTASSQFAASPASLILATNESKTIRLTFTPAQSGTAISSLVLRANASTDLTFFLSGMGVAVAPDMGLSYILNPDGNQTPLADGQTLPFPLTAVAATRTATILITNKGAAAGTVSAVNLSGAAFRLSALPLLPAQLQPSSSLQFTVVFAPTTSDPVQGSLQIALGASTITIPLTGQGATPLLRFQVLSGTSAGPVAPGTVIGFPDTAVDASATLTIQVQNEGNAAGTIGSVTAVGTAFRIANLAPLPISLPPGTSTTFDVIFAPAAPGDASGRLIVDSNSFLLAGTGLGSQLAFSLVVGSSTTPLPVGGTASFPNTVVGGVVAGTLSLQNTGNQDATVNSISLSGTVFGSTIPPLPASIKPAGTLNIPISFAPDVLGQLSATLSIDSFTFTLKGFGSTPATLPAYSFSGIGVSAGAGEQPSVGLTLASPYASDITGSLTLSFASDSFANDPAIQFATGGVVTPFRIKAGSTIATFGAATSIQFQTGTVAGRITLTPSFVIGKVNMTPTEPATWSVTVGQAAPVLRNVQIANQTASSFDVLISGYSTPRSVSQLTLQFNGAAGSNLQTSSLTVNAETAFSSWYQSSSSVAAGSQFTATVTITVNGDISAVQSLAVTAANSKGVSNTVNASLR